MFWTKKENIAKKVLVRVVVKGNDYQGKTFSKVIEIPSGFSFRVEIGYDAVLDQFGNKVRVLDYKAGFEIEREYIYEIQ